MLLGLATLSYIALIQCLSKTKLCRNKCRTIYIAASAHFNIGSDNLILKLLKVFFLLSNMYWRNRFLIIFFQHTYLILKKKKTNTFNMLHNIYYLAQIIKLHKLYWSHLSSIKISCQTQLGDCLNGDSIWQLYKSGDLSGWNVTDGQSYSVSSCVVKFLHTKDW